MQRDKGKPIDNNVLKLKYRASTARYTFFLRENCENIKSQMNILDYKL